MEGDAREKEDKANPEEEGMGTRVLLIEDSRLHIKLVESILHYKGSEMFHLESVGTLAEGIKTLAKSAFDVVLLDLGLPDSFGFATFEKIHGAVPETPIVILTASEDESLAMRALREGAQDYLYKEDINRRLLSRVVRYSIERKKLEEELRKQRNGLEKAYGELNETNRKLRDEVEKRRFLENQFRHLAMHDSLTGLPNRLLFFDRLQQAVRRGIRYEDPFSLMFLDLDGFKGINDNHGHETGDRVLQEVARRLQGVLRKSDTVARIGGDEFAVIVQSTANAENAEMAARKIISVLSMPIPLPEGECRFGVSVGISLCPKDGTDPDALLNKSDQAMYRAKQQGSNLYQFA